MAILDTLIIQLDLDGSALTKGAAAARQSLIGLEKQAEHTAQATRQALEGQLGQAASNGADSFRRFRQEAMGALALFTGGRSLAGLGQEITQANAELSTLASHLTNLPDGLGSLNTLHRATQGLSSFSTPPISPIATNGADEADGAGDTAPHNQPATPHAPAWPDISRTSQPINPQNSSSQDTPSQAMTGPAMASPLAPALADWAALLGRASHLARQALQEVEPTLHNAEQAMARLTARAATSAAPGHPPMPDEQTSRAEPANPIPGLLEASALLTARSILTTQPTSPQSGNPQEDTHPAQPPLTTARQGDTARHTAPATPATGQNNPTNPPAIPNPAIPNPAIPTPAQTPPQAPIPGKTPSQRSGRESSQGSGQTQAHIPHAGPALPASPAPSRGEAAYQGRGHTPSPPLRLEQISQGLHRLSQTLANRWGRADGTGPAMAQLTPLPPAFTRLAGQVDAATAPRHVTTHNNTTHSPTIHITVEAGNATPHDIARAIQNQAFAHFNTYRRIA